MKIHTFYATAQEFSNGKADSNSLMPMALRAISGTTPRGLNVLSGTTAEMLKIEAGGCYAMQALELSKNDDAYREDAEDRQGNPVLRQFNFIMLAPVDIIKAVELGMSSPPVVLIESESAKDGAKPKKKGKKAKKAKSEPVELDDEA